MCVACPHLGVDFTLSQLRKLTISGDIGGYTLGFGQPWHVLDACISMGASMGMALRLDKGRSDTEQNHEIVAVIGDSTFLLMGMQGLLDIVHNRGNVTVLLLDNRAAGTRAYSFDASTIAQKPGDIRLGNTVMLGAISDHLSFPAEVLERCALKRFASKKAELIELKRRAFAAGQAAAEDAAKAEATADAR